MSVLERFVSIANKLVQLSILLIGLVLVGIMSAFARYFGLVSFYFLGGACLGLAVAIIVIVRSLREQFKINIKDREIGIVFDKKGDFHTFLDSGTHFINTSAYNVENTIPIKGNKIGDESIFRTKEGIRVRVIWETKYEFIRERLLNEADEEKRKGNAYSIVKPPFGKVGGMTQGVLRQTLEQKSVRELFLCENNINLMNELEKEITDELQTKLKPKIEDAASHILAEDSGKVSIKAILFPNKIEEKIEEYYTQYLFVGVEPFEFTAPSKN